MDTMNDKICFTVESMLPDSITITLTAACICFVTSLLATFLAAAMIYLGLKQRQSEIRFCVVVSVTLASIISGIMHLDKYLLLKRNAAQPETQDEFIWDFEPTTTQPPPKHLVFISPGLCETLQFLHEFAFSSLIVWLAAECTRLVVISSVKTRVNLQRHPWFGFGIFLVPGVLYPVTFVGLWLIFKLIHRQHWLGCLERNDYDLTVSVPNAFLSAMTCFFSFCLVLVFCLPKRARNGQIKFLPCLVSWLTSQPLQAMTLLQTMNYASQKFELYYGESHDMAYHTLNMAYGLWIVAHYTVLLVCDWRQARYQSRDMIRLIM